MLEGGSALSLHLSAGDGSPGKRGSLLTSKPLSSSVLPSEPSQFLPSENKTETSADAKTLPRPSVPPSTIKHFERQSP